MRVLLVANTAASMVWFRRPFLERLVERGHRVWVVAPDGWGVDPILATGASFLPLHTTQGWAFGAEAGTAASYLHPLRDLETADHLRRVCRVVRPDVVLAYTHKMTLITPLAARLARAPRVHGMITGMGYANLGGSPRAEAMRRAYHASLRAAATLCDSLILLNRDNLDEARRAHLAPDAKLFLMDGEGVDVARFDAPAPEATAGRVTFLTIARLVHHKGIGELAAAAARLRPRYPHARFVVAGSRDPNHPDAIPGPELDRWQREGLLDLVGHVDDVPGLLREAHVFVLPSYATEGLPMSILEAMAARRAIVTTRAPGNTETVDEGVNGFLVPQRDPLALADALQRYLDKPAWVTTHGEASRARCVARFDHRIVNEALLTHLGL